MYRGYTYKDGIGILENLSINLDESEKERFRNNFGFIYERRVFLLGIADYRSLLAITTVAYSLFNQEGNFYLDGRVLIDLTRRIKASGLSERVKFFGKNEGGLVIRTMN